MRCQSNCVTSSGVCVTRLINNKSILFFYSAIWSLAINSSGVKGIPEERAAQLSGKWAWRAMFSNHFTESHQCYQVKLPWTLLLSLCCAQCTNKPSSPSCRLSQRPSTGLYSTYLHASLHTQTGRHTDSVQIQSECIDSGKVGDASNQSTPPSSLFSFSNLKTETVPGKIMRTFWMDGNNQTTDFWTHTHKLIKRVIKQKQSCAPNLHFIQVFAITFFFFDWYDRRNWSTLPFTGRIDAICKQEDVDQTGKRRLIKWVIAIFNRLISLLDSPRRVTLMLAFSTG